MNRRTFLKETASAAAFNAVLADWAFGGENAPKATVVAVRNGEPAAMFKLGIEKLGGMKAFVKAGQTVVVKPNIAWDKTPDEAANTQPELVAEIIREALACGAKKVEVFDHTCNAERPSYEHSGIEAAVKAAGGTLLSGSNKADYREVSRPAAGRMKSALIHRAILDADVFINVPVLKNHGGALMTACMKNFMGLVWDRGFMHRNNLPQCIADAALYRKPDLNVVDAYHIMLTNGPRGVSIADVTTPKYQLLSTDLVAADTLAAKLMKYAHAEVKYLPIAAKMGIGCDAESSINVVRVNA